MTRRILVAVGLVLALGASGQEPNDELRPVKKVVAGPTDGEILREARSRIQRNSDAFFADGQFGAVVEQQRLLCELNIHDEESWSNLHWMYYNIERLDLQWILSRDWAKNNPKYADARYYEALMFFMKRVYAKVPPLLEPAIAGPTSPDPNAYRLLAISYNRLGYWQDAVRVYDKYLAIKPDDATAIANRDRIKSRLKG